MITSQPNTTAEQLQILTSLAMDGINSDVRDALGKILGRIDGVKDLVLDAVLITPLNVVAGFSFLKVSSVAWYVNILSRLWHVLSLCLVLCWGLGDSQSTFRSFKLTRSTPLNRLDHELLMAKRRLFGTCDSFSCPDPCD